MPWLTPTRLPLKRCFRSRLTSCDPHHACAHVPRGVDDAPARQALCVRADDAPGPAWWPSLPVAVLILMRVIRSPVRCWCRAALRDILRCAPKHRRSGMLGLFRARSSSPLCGGWVPYLAVVSPLTVGTIRLGLTRVNRVRRGTGVGSAQIALRGSRGQPGPPAFPVSEAAREEVEQ